MSVSRELNALDDEAAFDLIKGRFYRYVQTVTDWWYTHPPNPNNPEANHSVGTLLSQCHFWTGGRDDKGYGIFHAVLPPIKGLSKRKGRSHRAHRFAWFLAHRHYPANSMLLRHKCNRPCCVNPRHLELGTQKENVRDRVIAGRSAVGSKNGQSRLNEAKVSEIFEILEKNPNKSCSEIGSQFGVSGSCIRQIRNGKTWVSLKARWDAQEKILNAEPSKNVSFP